MSEVKNGETIQKGGKDLSGGFCRPVCDLLLSKLSLLFFLNCLTSTQKKKSNHFTRVQSSLPRNNFSPPHIFLIDFFCLFRTTTSTEERKKREGCAALPPFINIYQNNEKQEARTKTRGQGEKHAYVEYCMSKKRRGKDTTQPHNDDKSSTRPQFNFV